MSTKKKILNKIGWFIYGLLRCIFIVLLVSVFEIGFYLIAIKLFHPTMYFRLIDWITSIFLMIVGFVGSFLFINENY